jgi:hypothetical protein
MRSLKYLSVIKNILLDTGFYEDDEFDTMLDSNSKKKEKKSKNKGLMYGAPFHYQVSILLGRTWKTIWREKVHIDLIFPRSCFITFATNCTDPDDNAFHSSRLYCFFDGYAVLADRRRRRRYIQQHRHDLL